MKLLHGVGINDAEYAVSRYETVGGKNKRVWTCPFYLKWNGMLYRCYSKKFHLKQPSYASCSTVEEWHRFTSFRTWMEKQDWEGKELDKDLLIRGNKIYGPDTCLFISKSVNSFLVERQNHRGQWPIGVSWQAREGKFAAQCNEFLTGKRKHLGYYQNPDDAHRAWLEYKKCQIKDLIEQEQDPIVAKALFERYQNY